VTGDLSRGEPSATEVTPVTIVFRTGVVEGGDESVCGQSVGVESAGVGL
jgi:hypothetical protein